MTKLEIYRTLLKMDFDNADLKRETLNYRIKCIIDITGCDYQSAYRVVKAVRCGEDMFDYVMEHDYKKARKELKGIRAWWNRHAKKQFKTPLTEKEFIDECIDEYMNTGSVEMRAFFSKCGHTLNWL